MRIGTESSARFQFAAEILQLLFRNATFEVGAGIDSRCGVSLEVDHIAVPTFRLRAEKMVERNFVKRGGGGEGRNMSANAFLNLIGADHHGKRIPADQAFDAAFHFLTPWAGRLLPGGDR